MQRFRSYVEQDLIFSPEFTGQNRGFVPGRHLDSLNIKECNHQGRYLY